DLAGNVDRSANIVPSADLADSQHISGLETNVSIGIAGQCAPDCYRAMLQLNVIAVDDLIARKIGFVLESIALESTGKPQKIGRTHAIRQRVLARTHYFAVDRNLGCIGVIPPKDTHGIEGLECRSRGTLFQNIAKIEANDLRAEIGGMQANNLRAIGR